VQAEIEEHGDGGEDASEEQRAGGARGGFKAGSGFSGVRLSLEQDEGDGGDDRGAGGVKQALENVHAENTGDGKFLFAGDEQRTDGFAGTA
jgi:hypothetical protein